MASTPRGLSRKCKLFHSENKFDHIRIHLEEELYRKIDGINVVVEEENSLIYLSRLILKYKIMNLIIMKILYIRVGTQIGKNPRKNRTITY